MTIRVAIPMSNWNGRFMGTGGGGFSGGSSPSSTNGPVPQGYATAGTDTGHTGGSGSFALDGVTDGVIEDPNRCTFDPKSLVGTSAGDDCGTFTEADANMIRKLWEAPRRKDGSFLWVGLPIGAPLNSISPVGGNPPRPQAFGISLEWFRYFLKQNAQFDWMTIPLDGYEPLFDQSVEQFGAVIGTDNPDLTEFKNRGGKAIVWHGWADPLISASGTIDYYKRVQQTMGGPQQTSSFVRLFMAPDVGHCGGGNGPASTGQMEALLAWVEEGRAPETLTATRNAGGVNRTRPLCQYPLVARYRGTGSTDDAANFVCSAGF